MPPQQVTQRKSWMYALIGGGIACLVAAYQYAFITPAEGAPSLAVGLIFTAIAPVLFVFVAAAVIASKVRESGTLAAVTDLNAPAAEP